MQLASSMKRGEKTDMCGPGFVWGGWEIRNQLPTALCHSEHDQGCGKYPG